MAQLAMLSCIRVCSKLMSSKLRLQVLVLWDLEKQPLWKHFAVVCEPA